jgi:dihydropyrimidinase
MATARVDTIVRGGRVVTATEALDTSVAIRGGRIVALGHDEALPPADRTIDATGKIGLPDRHGEIIDAALVHHVLAGSE